MENDDRDEFDEPYGFHGSNNSTELLKRCHELSKCHQVRNNDASDRQAETATLSKIMMGWAHLKIALVCDDDDDDV